MGHLFVAQGDLTRLACDALVIPCDTAFNVNKVWADVLPAGLPVGDRDDWLRLWHDPTGSGVVELPPNAGRRVVAVVTVDGPAEPADVVDRIWQAFAHVSAGLAPGQGRHVALVGIPLVGTGHGGLADRRGEVIDELLSRHRSTPLDVDLALIVHDRRDFAAVQMRRRPQADWPDLDPALIADADRLGELAGSGQLSLFLGAGVSTPVGLPVWWQLLDELAEAAGPNHPSHSLPPEDAATDIVAALGERYERKIQELLDVPRHAVGHALLAGLRVKQMVTTNFDPCMELALEPVLRSEFRVLVRQLADTGQPWLLKLNGDIKQPRTVVLTREDFQKQRDESAALRGVVQGLMLTSHLLFVGFSLTDESFLELAAAVSRVRAAADVAEVPKAGTALALTKEAAGRAGYTELHMISMLDEDDRPEAARLMEIFLDRLSWAAAATHDLAVEYLLDDRYASGLSEPDRALREVLSGFMANASSEAKSSPGWSRVAAALKSLGAELPQ